MAEKLTPKFTPMSADGVLATDWPDRVRRAVEPVRQGLRMSKNGLSIEAQCLYSSLWRPIMLPNSHNQFTTMEDCRKVFWVVTGNG